MSNRKFEYDAECSVCEGAGVYRGVCERDGIAVQCKYCKGSGQIHHIIKWKEAQGRKELAAVKRVLFCNPRIMTGENSQMSVSIEDYGGMSYKDWKAGLPFPARSEMRWFTCPAEWYKFANVDLVPYHSVPAWGECDQREDDRYPSCLLFGLKYKCWERFDRESVEEKKIC